MDIPFTSLSDFENTFPDDVSCIQWLWSVRNEVAPGCPYCGEFKIFNNNDGKTKKCSNKICRNKLSITTKSLIAGTKVPISKWMEFMFLYVKSRGRFSTTTNFSNPVHAYTADKILKEVFSTVQKEGVTQEWMFIQGWKRIFILNSKGVEFKKSDKGERWLIKPNDILDFQKEEIYRKAVLFATKTIHNSVRRDFILFAFIEATDLVAETIMNICDSQENVGAVTGDLFVKATYSTLYKLWKAKMKEMPNYEDYRKTYNRDKKREMRINLSNYYIKSLICTEDSRKGKWKEEKTFSELKDRIEKKRVKIRANREKRGYISSFEFNY